MFDWVTLISLTAGQLVLLSLINGISSKLSRRMSDESYAVWDTIAKLQNRMKKIETQEETKNV